MRIPARYLSVALCLFAIMCAIGCGGKGKSSSRMSGTASPASKADIAVKSDTKNDTPTAKTPVVALAKPKAADLLAQLQKTYRQMPSLRIAGSSETTVSADGKTLGKPVRENVSLVFKRPNRMIVHTPASDMTVDGKTVYTYSTAAKQYIQSPVNSAFLKSLTTDKPGIGILGLLFATDYSKMIVSPKLLPDTKINGRDVYVVTFGLKSGVAIRKGATGKQTLWIGKSDMGVYKNQLTLVLDTRQFSRVPPSGRKGKIAKIIETVTTNQQTEFEPNAKVPDSTFKFKPPTGSKMFKKPNLLGQMNKPAPDFQFTSVDGKVRRLSDLKGKFVILNFWALPICEQQLPILQNLSASLGPDTEMLNINANVQRDAISEELKKKNYTFPVVFADQEIARVAGQQYGLRVLPTMYIIDKKGVIRAQFLGLATQKQIEDRLASIRSK